MTSRTPHHWLLSGLARVAAENPAPQSADAVLGKTNMAGELSFNSVKEGMTVAPKWQHPTLEEGRAQFIDTTEYDTILTTP